MFFYNAQGELGVTSSGFMAEEKILNLYGYVPGFEAAVAAPIEVVVEESVVEQPFVEVVVDEPIVEAPVVEEAAPVEKKVSDLGTTDVILEIVKEEVLEVLEDPIVDSLGEDFEIDILTPPSVNLEDVLVDIEVPAPAEEIVASDEVMPEADDFVSKFLGASEETES